MTVSFFTRNPGTRRSRVRLSAWSVERYLHLFPGGCHRQRDLAFDDAQIMNIGRVDPFAIHRYLDFPRS